MDSASRRRRWMLALATAAAGMPAWAGGQLPALRQAACDAREAQTVLLPVPAHPAGTQEAASQVHEARAMWLDHQHIRWPGADGGGRFRLHHALLGGLSVRIGEPVSGAGRSLRLAHAGTGLPASVADRFRYLKPGPVLALRAADLPLAPGLHQGQLLLTREDDSGRVLEATRVQVPGALDDLYGQAGSLGDLGATLHGRATRFRLWAPTAWQVGVCLHASADGPSQAMVPMRRDARTGAWMASLPRNLSGQAYTYLVDVFVPGTGWVRNRVTDPYALGLTTDSRRSVVVDLSSKASMPSGWGDTPVPPTVQAPTDMVVYELHVRDFSASDASVPPEHRGKYLAFTHAGSDGMRHLRALAAAGVTDVHLLPVFDFGSVPESGCATPSPSGPPDGLSQQAAVVVMKARDCFNWGYDPVHYTAPEGSYATDPSDGLGRVRELRQMVMALHRAGLRVGMDVVYNHTYASGQREMSVLDRIVPGYYHRLDERGAVERSTCCDNTATEHLMMGKLMADSVAAWARHYGIDSFRFDLMGHQPRALMEALQRRLRAETGRDIPLIGEGWNFGEVADGARFVQASQLSLNGTGIGTFSDRLRDAVRGGGAGDSGEALVARQGYVNGLSYDANAVSKQGRDELLRAADLVRVGLAGSLRDYPLLTWQGDVRPLERVDYGGQPAGYASQPSEVVNYVENHDNQTLFDTNAMKLPVDTSPEDRARVQVLAAALVAFSQGVAYFHAGIDTLRSKSLDRNSFDSGDWFNRLDWRYADNHFGAGLPPEADNGGSHAQMRPLLADARLKPRPADIAWTRDAFRDLLRIRASSRLFRLRTADEVRERLRFPNSGPSQLPTLMAGHLDGHGLPGAAFEELVYLVNVAPQEQAVSIPSLKDKAFVLHPVHLDPAAADRRPAERARYAPAQGRFTVPPRSAVVFVVH